MANGVINEKKWVLSKKEYHCEKCGTMLVLNRYKTTVSRDPNSEDYYPTKYLATVVYNKEAFYFEKCQRYYSEEEIAELSKGGK